MLNSNLTTPIYVKTDPKMPLPTDPVYYLLTSSGLFLCRNHQFFRSCVPARKFPGELCWHDASLNVLYPRLRPFQLAQILAFFIYVGERFSAEAIVLLAWDETHRRVRVVVPEQVATVGRNRRNETWPIGVEYEAPKDLPADWNLYGDIHSHVDGPAYASFVDRYDEAYKPGLHVIIGRVFDKKPDYLAQAVVDGTRFSLEMLHVVEGLHKPPTRFPQRWLSKVQIEWPGQNPQPIVGMTQKSQIIEHDHQSGERRW